MLQASNVGKYLPTYVTFEKICYFVLVHSGSDCLVYVSERTITNEIFCSTTNFKKQAR